MIVCGRDYRDIAVSCWQMDFGVIQWANDPEDIAQFFADYRRLLEHWRETRPMEWFDIAYEDLVLDPEGNCRRMIEFLGLDWNPACLEFHSTSRVVRTASLTQVRKPLYSRSVGRWRRYARHLRPLFQALVRHGIAVSGESRHFDDVALILPAEIGDDPGAERRVAVGEARSRFKMSSGTLKRALAFHAKGRLSDAEILYRRVLLDAPDSVPALQGLGVLVFQLGRAEEASILFAKGLAVRPRSASLHANLAETQRLLKCLDEAGVHIQTSLELDPYNPAAWNTCGLIAYDQGRDDDAEAAYHRAVRIQPRFAAAYVNLGILRAARRRWDEAEDALRTAADIDPENALGLTHLGRVLSETGEPDLLDEAESLCREALCLQPRLVIAHINLGVTLHARRRRAEAADALRAALQLEPDNPLALTRLGKVLGDVGDIELLDEAEALCHRAVDLAPHLAEVFNNLGEVLRLEGRLNEALEHYQRALELEPNWAMPHWNTGVVLQETGHYDHAAHFYRMAQALDGDMATYYGHFGSLSAVREQYDEAARHYELSLSYRPDDPDALVALGVTRMEQGRHDEAEVCFREALRIDPVSTDPWIAFSRLRAERGEFDLACQAARTALERQPKLGPAYCQLATILRDHLPDADVETMRELIDHKFIPDGGRARLRFAMAGVMEARECYAEAAALLEAANAMQSTVRAAMGQAYNPDQHSRLIDRFIAAFTPDYLAPRHGWGDPSRKPVFIVGLPRSGTTLVEQPAFLVLLQSRRHRKIDIQVFHKLAPSSPLRLHTRKVVNNLATEYMS